jgi:L-ascorbate metabolism protein UlaG (beta-lactamase superfamily)
MEYAGKKFLVDPMFSKKGELAATPHTPNQQANPLVELSIELNEYKKPDAILLTHTHRDHFDDEAIAFLPKETLLFCQSEDKARVEEASFTQVQVVQEKNTWEGITITRTSGQHGRGEIGKQMGAVSGFILQAAGEPSVYIIGDSIWCEEVEQALEENRPEVIVAFAGAAQFLTGGAITMDMEDLRQLRLASPESNIIVTHMDAWNHCLLTRKNLSDYLVQRDMFDGFHLPQDGEILSFHR